MTRFRNMFAQVRPDERLALSLSFAMFFLLLAAYYIIRPVRDEMGVTVGGDNLHGLFTIVFVVMIAAVPLFGAVAARVPRRIVLPALYGFFIVNLLGFWLWFRSHGPEPVSAGAFFVWGSVFNLFVVSLFWSLMSELWTNSEARRLYGFVAAGGTAGALAGPLLTQNLLNWFKPTDLLLVSALLLCASLTASVVLRQVRQPNEAGAEQPIGGGIMDGLKLLLQSPYLGRIALFIFLANVAGTFFYLEQARLVAETLPDATERVRFFSGRDLMVSVATLSIQIFGTARILQSFGLTVALLVLPITALVGTLALSVAPILWVVAAVMVAERVVAFALANPAIKVMWTLATPNEQYKAQNATDTVVYRGGDAVAGWLFAVIGRGAGFGAINIVLAGLAAVAVWIWTARGLGAAHKDRVSSETQAGSAAT